MKKLFTKNGLLFIGILSMVSFIPFKSQATHSAGADIWYEKVGNNQYKISVAFFRDCLGILEDNGVLVRVKSVSKGFNQEFIAPKKSPPNGEIVTFTCPTGVPTCLGGTAVGIRRWVYEVTVSLPDTAADWTFSWRECNRNNAITTVINAGNFCMYIEAKLNNTIFSNNNAPIFTNPPIALACIGQNFNYNQGSYDSEGDSLFYELINPKHTATANVPLNPPFTVISPMSSSTPFSLNSLTGALNFTPTQIEVGILASRVKEYRNGILIGSVIRDFQFYTRPCPNNTAPVASGFNGTNIYEDTICAGTNACYFMNSIDPEVNQNVVMTSNVTSVIPGSTFTATNASRPVGNFCWQTDTSDVRSTPHVFTIRVVDEFCPDAAVQDFTYAIWVEDVKAAISKTDETCNLIDGTATVVPTNGLPGYTYSYLWSNGQTSSTASSLVGGTYTVTVTSNRGCTVSKQIVVGGPPVTINLTPIVKANTGCNGICNGGINISPLGGTLYTYNWSTGTTNTFIANQCQGVYTVLVTDVSGCTAITSVTVPDSSLVVTCNLATTNDDGCQGVCNGTATATAVASSAVTYLWNTGATTSAITGLCGGIYTVTVTDTKGCSSTCSGIVLNQNTSFTVSVSRINNTGCNGVCNGSLTANTQGGTQFTYSWSNGATSKTISGICTGTYTVIVTDASGCTASSVRSIIDGGITITCNATSLPNTICNGTCNGSAVVTATGGTALSYLWSNGQTTASASGLCPQTYTITVTDVSGCSSFCGVVVGNNPEPFAIQTTKTNVTCNGGSDGSITTSISGGTGPFSLIWSNGNTNLQATGFIAGTYTVTVTSGLGCTQTLSVSITQPTKIVAMRAITKSTCGDCSGKITLTVSGGVGPYTYLWSNGKTTKNNLNVCAGAYSVTITDSRGCTINPSYNVGDSIIAITILGVVINNTGCAGACNGSINVTPSGGAGFTYLWNNGATSNQISGICEGNYIVTVTNSAGCSKERTLVVGGQTTTISCTTNVIDNTGCNGLCNGSISALPAGGTSYTYQWTNGQTTAQLTGICSGTFTVTITDVTGCTSTCTGTVANLGTTISCSASATPNSNCGSACNGTVTATSSGSAAVSYSWSSGQTTQTATGLCAGTYTATVTNAAGCTSTCTAQVTNTLDNINVTATAVNVACFGGSNGGAATTLTGGTAPFNYLWSNGATTKDLSGITAGTYTVIVTSNTGCTVSASCNVTQPGPLMAVSTMTQSICGNCKGKVTLAVTGGIAPYTYQWSNGATTKNISNLCAASYTVTLTDVNGCASGAGATVSDSLVPVVINGSIVNNTGCGSSCNGNIQLTVSGGSTFVYAWSNGRTTKNIFNLCAGVYTVTVTNNLGCNATSSFSVSGSSINVTCTVNSKNNTGCNGNCNGELNAIPSGGSSYAYLWSNGSTTKKITGLCSGNYSVIVTDISGCSNVCSAIVADSSTAISCNATSTLNTGCNGNCNGTATAIPAGNGAFTYAWSNGQTNATATGLCGGNYTVTVTNTNGCSSTCNVAVVNQPETFTVSVSGTNILCNGGNNGTAAATVNGGTAPLTYVWSNGASIATISNLTKGTYTVTVTSAIGCTATASVVLTQPTALSITKSTVKSFCNNCAGKVSITVTGGKSPYTYSWSNGATTKNLATVCSGTYTVIVTDANQCTLTTSAFVADSAVNINITGTPVNNTACNNGCNGSISMNATGGNTFTYSWSNGSTTKNQSGLCAGNYTVTVINNFGCTATKSFSVGGQTTNITCSLTFVNNVSCGTGCFGSATAIPSGGSSYTYIWSNGKTTASLTKLCEGTYTVTVTDISGCTITASVVLLKFDLNLQSTVTKTDNTFCQQGQCTGTATVTPTGGSIYIYQWNTVPIQTTQTATGLCGGTYLSKVTDSITGCIVQKSITITNVNIGFALAIAQTSAIKCAGGTGALSANPTGGSSPFGYLWSNGKTTKSVAGLLTGSYTVTVTAANGCTNQANFTLTEPVALSCNATATANTCANPCNGSISIAGAGGTGSYQYNFGNGFGTSATATSLCAATYTVTVKDANNCSTTCSGIVNNNLPVCTPLMTGTVTNYRTSGQPTNFPRTYFENNFTLVYPNGLLIQSGGCLGAKSITLTDVASVKAVMQATGSPAVLTSNFVNPSLNDLNNTLAAQIAALKLNIDFDSSDPNFAPASTVYLYQMLIDSGPMTGLTVQQLYNQAVSVLSGCSSSYTPTVMRNYCLQVNNSWSLGTKRNNVLKCPTDPCALKFAEYTYNSNDLLQYSVFPNPTINAANLVFLASIIADYSIEVYDTKGRLISNLKGVAYEGINRILIPMENYTRGIYMVNFKYSGETRSTRLIKE
ncbi:MAG: T9SS type A sorting domain-containing protein [Bacteroidetes bacterium]|nr:T9SS type A sorting domain-containing protein [Bacteroidota bacterium]